MGGPDSSDRTDPINDTGPLKIPLTSVPPKKSATVTLVELIELSTGSSWTQPQRAAVADYIREYRFEQVSAVLLRVQALVREHGDKQLSEMIFFGKY